MIREVNHGVVFDILPGLSSVAAEYATKRPSGLMFGSVASTAAVSIAVSAPLSRLRAYKPSLPSFF